MLAQAKTYVCGTAITGQEPGRSRIESGICAGTAVFKYYVLFPENQILNQINIKAEISEAQIYEELKLSHEDLAGIPRCVLGPVTTGAYDPENRRPDHWIALLTVPPYWSGWCCGGLSPVLPPALQ